MRRALAHRPLLAMAMGLMGGLAFLVSPWSFLLAVPFLPFRRVGLWAVAGLLIGLAMAPRPAPLLLERTYVEGVGLVKDVPRFRPDHVEFTLEVRDRQWRTRIPGRPDVALGDRLAIRGIGRPLPDGLDDYARLRGIDGRLDIVAWRVEPGGSFLTRAAEAVRRPYEAFVYRILGGDAPLVLALSLNLDGALDEALRDRLRSTGTYHIVSASGLHVFAIATACLGLLSLLPIDRTLQIGLLAAILAFYALLTRLESPVLRASIMSIVGLCAYRFRRDADALSALGLAAIAYLLWRPRGVFEIGFQLSFVTVGGLILFAPPRRDDAGVSFGRSLWHRTVDAAKVSAVAFLASAPLVAKYFGTVSLLSIPANLLILLNSTAVVVLSLAAFAVSALVPALGAGILLLAGSLGRSIQAIVGTLASLPFATFTVPEIPTWFIVALYAALLATYRERIVQP
jgi:competence protein ComEC